jgi:hypothetical protein
MEFGFDRVAAGYIIRTPLNKLLVMGQIIIIIIILVTDLSGIRSTLSVTSPTRYPLRYFGRPKRKGWSDVGRDGCRYNYTFSSGRLKFSG